MSDEYHDLIERLKALLSENGASLEITAVQEADCPDVMLEIHAVRQDDPVLHPEDDEELEPGATGPWDRREVRVVVTLPCGTGGVVTAELSSPRGMLTTLGTGWFRFVGSLMMPVIRASQR